MESDSNMYESAERLTRALYNRQLLAAFTGRLIDWLVEESKPDEEVVPAFTNSRAKALLRSSDVVDEASLDDFWHLVENEVGERVAFYDLIADTILSDNEEVTALAQLPGTEEPDPIPWLSTIVAAYAWRSGYPLHQLDPATPPTSYSPAGQVLKRSAQFIRRQIQRSATERDKLARRLALPLSGAATLDDLESTGSPVAPLPPHFRPPVPENYPEMARETLEIDQEDIEDAPSITVGEPLVITEEEVAEEEGGSSEPVRMPPITISPDQVTPETATPPSPIPRSGVVMPSQTTSTGSRQGFTVALRQMFGQEELTSTKLKVLVQRYPDGPGLYGLQVRVTCKGVKSYVAGTTDREGKFVCELPVRIESGLTYDVDVTWPREEGSEVERKSITLNSDRTHFTLPFYRQLDPPEDVS
jgi:hypothetical protein